MIDWVAATGRDRAIPQVLAWATAAAVAAGLIWGAAGLVPLAATGDVLNQGDGSDTFALLDLPPLDAPLAEPGVLPVVADRPPDPAPEPREEVAPDLPAPAEPPDLPRPTTPTQEPAAADLPPDTPVLPDPDVPLPDPIAAPPAAPLADAPTLRPMRRPERTAVPPPLQNGAGVQGENAVTDSEVAAYRSAAYRVFARHMRRFRCFPGGVEAQLVLTLDPQGNVIAARLTRTSGNPLVDAQLVSMGRRTPRMPPPPRGDFDLIIDIDITC